MKINYTLNENNQIIGYTEIPFNPQLPWINIENLGDIHIGISTIEDGIFYEHRSEWEADVTQRQNIAAIKTEIRTLQQHLASTDYQAIKYAEGRLTAEEFAPMREQRQTWRDRINELQATLEAAD